MTLAGSLSALLESEWNLSGDLASTKLKFGEDWYDASELDKPQIIVTPLSSPVAQFFGTAITTLHHRFVINMWLRIPAGADGSDEKDDIEDIREEVFRIINHNRHDIDSFEIIVPLDEGVPRHELDSTPRVLRYEMVIFGVESKT